jgi:hypothetical protein
MVDVTSCQRQRTLPVGSNTEGQRLTYHEMDAQLLYYAYISTKILLIYRKNSSEGTEAPLHGRFQSAHMYVLVRMIHLQIHITDFDDIHYGTSDYEN